MHFRGFLLLAAVGSVAAAPPPPAAAAAAAPWPQTMEHIPLFVVSLARSPWRWADFVASGDALRDFPTLQRVDAVDGRGVDTRNDSRLSLSARVTIMRGSRRDHTDINTLGMVGCYLSHLALWQRIAAEGVPVAVIMEDDAGIKAGTRRAVDALLRLLPSPALWDVALLGHSDPPKEAPSRAFPGLSEVASWFGTIAYVVSARGAARLLRRALPILFQVDGFMAHLARLGELTVLHAGAVVNVRALNRRASSVQDTCHVCDLPHNYNRAADVGFWLLLGAALAALGSAAWDRGWLRAAGGWLARRAGSPACRGARALAAVGGHGSGGGALAARAPGAAGPAADDPHGDPAAGADSGWEGGAPSTAAAAAPGFAGAAAAGSAGGGGTAAAGAPQGVPGGALGLERLTSGLTGGGGGRG